MLQYSDIKEAYGPLREPVITIGKCNDARPQNNRRYFTKAKTTNDIAVIIPFYNEEANELKVTLKSLYSAYEYLCEMKEDWKDKQLHIMIIQDGWFKASKSMKKYLKELFPKKYLDVPWWEFNKEFQEQQEESATFFFESDDYVCINPEEEYKQDRLWLKITLVVKIDNRRKHNSHEWFMAKGGFAQSMNAKYLFFTDAFTTFGNTCLYHLVDTLDKNESYSAATGRQRVMGREQQGTYESTLSLAYLLRMVQMFDFELANAVYNGAFSLGGCLPVIPGPCGLYRGSDVLQDAVRDWYFNVVSVDPEKTGLILGNLKIAEDRILTYSSVLKTEDVKYMAFVSMAVFYFEAELSLERLILQRRRWINGSIAGYLYLLFTDSKHIRKWKTNFIRKSYIYFLLFCQFCIYCSVSIAPAYSLRMLHYSMYYLLEVNGYDGSEVSILTTIAWILYLSHILIHSQNKYNAYIMNLLLLLSFLTSILSLAAILFYVFIDTEENFFELMASGSYILYLTLFVFFGPFVLAFMLSLRGHSVINMLKAFIPYLLFLHMMISWFGSYSYSRTWDLTWGNRPTDEHGNDEKKDLTEKKYKMQGKNITLAIFVLNIIVFFLPRNWQLILLCVFFFCAGIQMCFSIIYMFIQLPKKLEYTFLKCRRCLKKQVSHVNYKNKKKMRKEIELELQKQKEEEKEKEEDKMEGSSDIEKGDIKLDVVETS